MKLKVQSVVLLIILVLAAITRLWALDKYPVGLNADEASIGYNAYSLIETGRDEHNQSWPLVFRSFDDYKPPLYFYLVLPFVKILGLNVWAVRLPSALFGILSVYLIYRLTNLLITQKEKDLNLGLVAALILTFSPWHLHFSRGGWEVNVATTLVLAGFVALFESPRRYWLAALAFVASLYAYHAMRLILPFLLLLFLVLERQEILSRPVVKKWIGPVAIAAVLLLPLAGQFLSAEGSARFSGVSVFADEGPLWEALALRQEHGGGNNLGLRVLHNKYITYSLRIAKNYLAHFSPRFLFITGDEIGRSRIPGVGQALLLTLPFFAIGLAQGLSKNNRGTKFILGWLALAPLAASITFQSPHALRAQNLVIPLTIITAMGIVSLWQTLSTRVARLIIISSLFLLFAYESTRLLHFYFLHYPKEDPVAWEYGFAELGGYVAAHYDEYDKIIISDRYDQPYILLAFFLKYPPEQFQQEIKLEPRDKFGFSTVRHFGKLEFKRIDFDQDLIENTLVAVTEEETTGIPIETINFPDGSPAFKLYTR